MQLSKRKKIVIMSLIGFIGVIILLSVIYNRTALWEPEQHLITLLPESPVCYLTLKELKGLVETFNRSELGKQTAKMPLLAEIQAQRWWRELVFQKQVWEYEMGGRLDLKTVTGYFGEETILAIYQREGELTFLLITAVGAQEKLSIEAMTATDAINPRYKRIQNRYGEFTINTITGYPRDFSYTFIGRIGILSLNPTLLIETLDIYNTRLPETKSVRKRQGFLAEHPMTTEIQENYRQDKSTGYADIKQIASVLNTVQSNALIKQIYGMFEGTDFWTFSNRYEDGVIISQHHLRKRIDPNQSKLPAADDAKPFPAFPERTACVTTFPVPNQQIRELFGNVDLSEILGTDMTVMLVAPEPDEATVVPSLVLLVRTKAPDALKAVLDIVKQGKISIAGKPLKFLEPQDYNGVAVHPLQLRLNFLLAVAGGYAIVDDYFVLSTTLTGLKSVIDTRTGKTPALRNITFSTGTNGVQVFIQPELLVPELKRFLPLVTVLASLTGQELDASLTRRITENLFPLESLGPISAEVNFGEQNVDAEVRIVLEK
ncbi:hypothetical protein F4009_10100 [Candidatus Poribacteria bacterium]|nr:hypothetical protein [Candidatus Poribacteria bacterium]MYH83644.1 hypothetical protein [Candidatus Poribacteria bacterium]MYK94327.1 hypothetical protein [Candidatus Poribacteria bacterium]